MIFRRQGQEAVTAEVEPIQIVETREEIGGKDTSEKEEEHRTTVKESVIMTALTDNSNMVTMIHSRETGMPKTPAATGGGIVVVIGNIMIIIILITTCLLYTSPSPRD